MKIPLFLLNQEITLMAYKGNNPHGEPIYGEITTLDTEIILTYESATKEYKIRGRIEPKIYGQRQQPGEDKIGRGTAWTLGTHIPVQSILKYNGQSYTVLNTKLQYAMNSISHLEVELG